jgi:pyruvate formate lyase activating enzyme
MLDKPHTPLPSLLKARQIALKNGVHYVYVGNAHDKTADSTYCHNCQNLLIGRDWYELSEWNLDNNGHCKFCGTRCAGLFDAQPGHWGAKRKAVTMN